MFGIRCYGFDCLCCTRAPPPIIAFVSKTPPAAAVAYMHVEAGKLPPGSLRLPKGRRNSSSRKRTEFSLVINRRLYICRSNQGHKSSCQSILGQLTKQPLCAGMSLRKSYLLSSLSYQGLLRCIVPAFAVYTFRNNDGKSSASPLSSSRAPQTL